LIKANWFRELGRVGRERELKSEEGLDAGISEAHPLAVLYEMVGLGWQQDSRHHKIGYVVMITVTLWFYRRVTMGGMAEDPGEWGAPRCKVRVVWTISRIQTRSFCHEDPD